eukprot:391248-Pelagomonas_calceolata.AAC.2
MEHRCPSLIRRFRSMSAAERQPPPIDCLVACKVRLFEPGRPDRVQQGSMEQCRSRPGVVRSQGRHVALSDVCRVGQFRIRVLNTV